MAAKKKYKRLTNKQKQLNKEIREELREKGIIPPVKPRLNRKKFAQEVWEEWEKENARYYLPSAVVCMAPNGKTQMSITPEEVGVLKVMKIALEFKKFEEEFEAKGESTYTATEFYEKVIAPIANL